MGRSVVCPGIHFSVSYLTVTTDTKQGKSLRTGQDEVPSSPVGPLLHL